MQRYTHCPDSDLVALRVGLALSGLPMDRAAAITALAMSTARAHARTMSHTPMVTLFTISTLLPQLSTPTKVTFAALSYKQMQTHRFWLHRNLKKILTRERGEIRRDEESFQDILSEVME
jgi:hypothetical protein